MKTKQQIESAYAAGRQHARKLKPLPKRAGSTFCAGYTHQVERQVERLGRKGKVEKALQFAAKLTKRGNESGK